MTSTRVVPARLGRRTRHFVAALSIAWPTAPAQPEPATTRAARTRPFAPKSSQVVQVTGSVPVTDAGQLGADVRRIDSSSGSRAGGSWRIARVGTHRPTVRAASGATSDDHIDWPSTHEVQRRSGPGGSTRDSTRTESSSMVCPAGSPEAQVSGTPEGNPAIERRWLRQPAEDAAHDAPLDSALAALGEGDVFCAGPDLDAAGRVAHAGPLAGHPHGVGELHWPQRRGHDPVGGSGGPLEHRQGRIGVRDRGVAGEGYPQVPRDHRGVAVLSLDDEPGTQRHHGVPVPDLERSREHRAQIGSSDPEHEA